MNMARSFLQTSERPCARVAIAQSLANSLYFHFWSRPTSRGIREDGPGGAVTEADQLLSDVMSTRGYPVSDFEQRAADISVGYPLVLENYRSAHAIALRQTHGQASTEELRQSMIHYRTLFDELVGVPEMARAKAAS
jgi:hypothetical protein